MATHQQAVITGAAAGIGAAFARHCAARSYDLLLVDRNADGLAAISRELTQRHAVRVRTMVVNLAEPAGIDGLIAAITNMPRLDLLVNNAGLSEQASFLDCDAVRLREIVAVHCTATMLLCKAALAKMGAQHTGAIINLASLTGLLVGYAGPNYSATKAYVLWLSRHLHREFRAAGVYVQALCPGHTRTNMHSEEAQRHIPKVFFCEAEQVVRASWSAMERRREVCIPGLRHQAVWLLGRLGILPIVWRGLLKLEYTLGLKVRSNRAP